MPKLSKRETIWLETLGNFGKFPTTLGHEEIHVLRDALSREPDGEEGAVIDDIEKKCI